MTEQRTVGIWDLLLPQSGKHLQRMNFPEMRSLFNCVLIPGKERGEKIIVFIYWVFKAPHGCLHSIYCIYFVKSWISSQRTLQANNVVQGKKQIGLLHRVQTGCLHLNSSTDLPKCFLPMYCITSYSCEFSFHISREWR